MVFWNSLQIMPISKYLTGLRQNHANQFCLDYKIQIIYVFNLVSVKMEI